MTTTARSFFALVAVAALALAGCASDDGAPEDEVVTTEGGESAEAIVDDATVAALTGETIEGGSLSRPALAGKIDNHPSARPQVGLDEADIVFEELVEGGLTRYIAVWHSTLPPEIGPVRSVRPMDPEIVSPFGGIFAYSGGQVRFIQMMQEAPVYNAIHGQPDTEDTFYRTSAKVAPHNVLVKAPELVDQHLDLPAPERQFAYAPSVEESTAVVAGSPVTSMNPRFSGFSSPTWEWDGTQGTFLRFQTNGAADSASSGNQIFATNVVVLQVGIDVVEDIPTTRLVNQGTGWVATGGSIAEINWFKATPESPIILTTDDGEEVRLGVGNTWIELIPNDSSDVEAGVLTIN
ncbi:MAG: DUF3048 domain-containing protein [Actinobacteria bacterium]|nr:DUF3048 domain-containing protein [Actinomycetota bacterium]